jgi:hypothetical protein
MASINDKPEKFVDPIEQAERMYEGMLTGEEFGDEDEDARVSYLHEDVADMKRQNFAASHLKNQTHSRKAGRSTRQQ